MFGYRKSSPLPPMSYLLLRALGRVKPANNRPPLLRRSPIDGLNSANLVGVVTTGVGWLPAPTRLVDADQQARAQIKRESKVHMLQACGYYCTHPLVMDSAHTQACPHAACFFKQADARDKLDAMLNRVDAAAQSAA